MEEKTLTSHTLYRGRILTLRVDTVQLPHGRQAQREIIEHAPAVTIVPLDENNNVLLVRQYRLAAQSHLLELPAGGIEPGEEPLEAAYRELEEETGRKAHTLQKLGSFYTGPGFCTEYMYAFLAQDLEHVAAHPEEDENIEVVPVPLAQIPDLIRQGQIQDAKTIASLLMVLHIHEA